MNCARHMMGWCCLLSATAFMAGCSNMFSGNTSGSEMNGTWTIQLKAFYGPDHDEEAKRYKQATEEKAGWRHLFIVSHANYSELLWGRYAKLQDTKPNLEKARAFVNVISNRKIPVYPTARAMPLPGKDPGPPELRLENAQGAYSVVVAVFYNKPEEGYTTSVEDAINYCKRLRKHDYEAYYHRGLSRTSVTIGAFPASSVQKVTVGDETTYKPMDPNIDKILADPQFKYLAVNGAGMIITKVSPKTGKAERVQLTPYVVHMPKKGDDADLSSDHTGHP